MTEPIARPALPLEQVLTTNALLGRAASVPALAVDDVTMDYGDREYRAMLRDPIIAANTNLYKAGVLSADPQIAPAVTDRDAGGYELAAELATWCTRMMEDLRIPLLTSLTEALSAITYGCTVAEVVLRQETAYSGRRQVVLDMIKAKPRDAVALSVDPYNNVVGVWANVRSAEGRQARQELPTNDFLIYTYHPEHADPRGTSLLRPAYVPWDMKMRIWPEYYRFLVQHANPTVVGIAAPGARPEVDDKGNPVDATTALLAHLLGIRNGAAVAVPHGSTVDLLFSQGEGGAFLSGFELCNREMTTAILAAARATMESQHGSRADSETATDVLDTFLRQTRLDLERAVRQQVLKRLVRLNYGDAAVALTPYLSLGGVTQDDVYKLMAGVSRLASQKLIFPSQIPELAQRMGLPVPSGEEVERATIGGPALVGTESGDDDDLSDAPEDV